MVDDKPFSADLADVQGAGAAAADVVAQADLQRRRFDMTGAEASAIRAVTDRPDDAKAHLVLGRVLLATRRLDEGQVEFTEAGRLAPDWDDAIAWRIATLSRQRRFDEAVALGEAARAGAFRESALVHIAVGRVYLDSSRPLDALPWLAESTRLQPNDIRAARWHAEALSALSRWSEGEELSQDVIARNPASARAYLTHGLLMIDSDRNSSALRSLEHAYMLDPDDPLVLEWRISVFRYLSNYDAALEAATEAVDRYPQCPRLHTERAWVFSNQDRQREALVHVERALTLDPGDEWALETKIDILGFLDRWSEANRTAVEALERRSDSVDLHLAAAKVARDHDVALRHVEDALTLDPRNPDALRYQIVRLGASRRFHDAEQTARAAGLLHPYNPSFAVALAEVYAGQDQCDKCEQALQDALGIDPHDAAAMSRTGALLLRKGESNAARDIFHQLLESHPDDPDLYIEVANRYADENQYTSRVIHADRSLCQFYPEQRHIYMKDDLFHERM